MDAVGYAVGPPRTGTLMMAACLAVLVPSHHECWAPEDGWLPLDDEACLSVPPSLRDGYRRVPRHGAFESSCWLSDYAPWLQAPVIHLWRPASEWLRSAYYMALENLTVGYDHTFDPPERYLTPERAASLCEDYNRIHRYLLQYDFLHIDINRIEWRTVFDWCGLKADAAQMVEIQRRWIAKPNRHDYHPALPPDLVALADERCGATEQLVRSVVDDR